MVAQETHQNPTIPLQNTEHFHKTDQFDQDPYEAEETLSLCDLPTHSDSAHWDDYRSSSNEEENEDDFFEFFSEDFTAATYPAGKDIIFCGKLIPLSKESPIFAADETNYKSQGIGNAKRPKKGILRKWKSDSKISRNVKEQKSMNTSLSFPQSKSYYKKCEMSKVSILSGSPSKSKWFLFMFGMARFPAEMELRDIRMRQSRRSPATMFGAKCEESGQMGSKGKMGKSGSRGKGLWGLLRAFSLGCGSRHSHHANAAVKGGLPPTLD